jgi:cytochrome c peroxidase
VAPWLSLLVAIAAATLVGAAERRVPLGLDLYMPVPDDNPLTSEKVALGRRLFSDPVLSRDRTRSCASCHNPRRAFTDGRAVAVGVRGQAGTRSAPALVNRGYGRAQFWDGRARTLEQQVAEPITNPRELDLSLDEAVDRLARTGGYPDRFQTAFGRAVNDEDLARALASYVRSIVSGNSPFDRYVNGEVGALSDRARRGLQLFRGKANCTACHVGPLLTDEEFHNTGVAWRPPAQQPGSGQAGPGQASFQDLGRFLVTGKDSDRGAFKTPTLREIARTAPYMHDGSLATLDDVIEYYERGGNPNVFRDPELRPLALSADDRRALVAFLESLSGKVYDGVTPRVVR